MLVTVVFPCAPQIPTACGLGVLVNPDLSVAYAGGYLVQLLPFAPEADIAQLEENLKGITSVTELLQNGLLDRILREAERDPSLILPYHANYTWLFPDERSMNMTTLVNEPQNIFKLDFRKISRDLFVLSIWFGNIFINVIIIRFGTFYSRSINK